MLTDDGDDDDYEIDDFEWPELEPADECGQHCVTLTLHTEEGPGRIMERHCRCEWCHGSGPA